MELSKKYDTIHIAINVMQENEFRTKIETVRGRGAC